MPCYDGRDEIERKCRDKKTARVEAVLGAVVSSFGLDRVLYHVNPAECRVTKQWIEDWWQKHEREDEIRRRMQEVNATHVLTRMIEREEDIQATVAALEALVPAGSETFAPPCPTASGVLTAHFGNVRVVSLVRLLGSNLIRPFPSRWPSVAACRLPAPGRC
jgi:hypothetical protein